MNSVHATERVARSATDWSSVGPNGHAVQFYEHDSVLVDQLAGYVGMALVTGDAAVVFATTKRRQELRARLALRGLDVEVARSEGRFASVDGEAAMREFMSEDGWPDRAKFRDVVGDILNRVRSATGIDCPRIAAYGEIVALLCSAGRFAAAVRIEELWNEMAREHSFSLFCAYPMSLFKTDVDAAARFMKVCAQHSHVFSAERRSLFSRPRSI